MPDQSLPRDSAPRTRRGAQTRSRLLRAAEEAFGSRGYHRAGISDITLAAGVAQGTFYSYFRNKEEVLRELVRNMGRDLRAHLAAEISDARDRLDAEARGLRAFLAYVAGHPWMYRVLQEAQFVDESIYREYYEAFGESYLRLLDVAEADGEVRPGDNRIRVWALMGMAHFLGLRYGLWERDVPLDRVVDTVRDLLRSGLMTGEHNNE
ncbi:TetR/AcrR family transcriptional regulator [Aquisalimonas asiatica]|uniref:Transcriptional regulator, TetR family n=1 Tax=Aquisalimonas asiatica TaxID=406100 RepID=A0A1H8V3F0_9GAMM|nr:TetR/AcrR family transcriptional regulator [Aquisalimonas asiatica]SEP09743.1 transcriptional regulator, TetR family [Aquisalimonas asiatica]